MPLSDFYTYQIEETSSTSLIAQVSIDPKHEVYKGHFPEQPVTPGVILVEMARNILSIHTKKELMLSSAKELKFMSPIIPTENTEITIHINFEVVENDYKVSCVFLAGNKTFTKLKGIFSAS